MTATIFITAIATKEITMESTKPLEDFTPADFIQHSANLDHWERILSGMARLGKNTTHPDLYNATDSTVKKYRAQRAAYFVHHGIKSDIENSFVNEQ